MKMKKILIPLLFVSAGYFFHGCSDKSENFNNGIIEVETAQVKQIDGSEVLSYSGTIEESESIPLSFSVVGSESTCFRR
jgi:hypothetical protein